MASLAFFVVLIALGQCHRFDESLYQNQYNSVEQQLQDKINVESYKKEFKEVNYRLNKLGHVLEKVLENIEGVQEVVGYPTTLEQALEVTKVESKDNQFFKVVYNTDKIVKLVDSEGEIALPKGSSLLTVKHEGTEKYWNLMKKSDVMIYHHHGSPVMVYTYNKEGELKQTLLGNSFEHVEAQFSMVIPQETFFVVEVLDKQEESFAVLSYSFFPGFVQEYHVKYPVEEQQQGIYYKPTYLVRQYFGLEDVEPVFVNEQQYQYTRIPRSQKFTKNVIDKVLSQYMNINSQELPFQYSKINPFSRRSIYTPRYLQKYSKYNTPSGIFNQETPVEYYLQKYYGQQYSQQYNKIEGLLTYLVKMNVLPVQILKELPIQSYEKVEGLLRQLVKKNILPMEILSELQTESYEQMQDVDSILPVEIKEYLYQHMTPQDLKKYVEDIPSFVKWYLLNTPKSVRSYFQNTQQTYPMYLENIPQYVRQYLENTPMDVKKFFENTPEEVKNYYDVLPMYVKKYFQIIPKVVRKYLENIPEETQYNFYKYGQGMKSLQGIPSIVRQYIENTPEEVKTFFQQTPEHIQSYYGKMPVQIRKYFENTPKDVKKFFETIEGEKKYNEVLPKYIRKYFQTKPWNVSKYDITVPSYNKYNTVPSYNKYNTVPSYNKYNTINKYNNLPSFVKEYLRSEETY